jgi:hypothetical protein
MSEQQKKTDTKKKPRTTWLSIKRGDHVEWHAGCQTLVFGKGPDECRLCNAHRRLDQAAQVIAALIKRVDALEAKQ